jgi:hypothetical protein
MLGCLEKFMQITATVPSQVSDLTQNLSNGAPASKKEKLDASQAKNMASAVSITLSDEAARALSATPDTKAADNADYENNLKRFHGLASVILDSSGNYSDDQKLDAWNGQFRMAVTGQLKGFGPDEAKLINDIATSDISGKIETARVAFANAQVTAIQQADATGGDRGQMAAQAALKYLGGLGGFDQKLAFASINTPNRTGATRYASMDDWKQQLSLLAGLFKPIDNPSAKDSGTSAKTVSNVSIYPQTPSTGLGNQTDVEA